MYILNRSSVSPGDLEQMDFRISRVFAQWSAHWSYCRSQTPYQVKDMIGVNSGELKAFFLLFSFFKPPIIGTFTLTKKKINENKMQALHRGKEVCSVFRGNKASAIISPPLYPVGGVGGG